jgi:hypothetical protein
MVGFISYILLSDMYFGGAGSSSAGPLTTLTEAVRGFPQFRLQIPE